MSLSAHQLHPRVVVPGDCRVRPIHYKGDGSTTLEPGNLVRVTTSAQIKLALEAAATAGAIHGICLSTGYHTTAATTSQFVVILAFADNTHFHIQLYAAAAGDAEPQDVTVETGYRVVRAASYDAINRSCLDVANADGDLTVTLKPSDVLWYWSDYDADQDYGIVQARVDQTCLDGHQA